MSNISEENARANNDGARLPCVVTKNIALVIFGREKKNELSVLYSSSLILITISAFIQIKRNNINGNEYPSFCERKLINFGKLPFRVE